MALTFRTRPCPRHPWSFLLWAGLFFRLPSATWGLYQGPGLIWNSSVSPIPFPPLRFSASLLRMCRFSHSSLLPPRTSSHLLSLARCSFLIPLLDPLFVLPSYPCACFCLPITYLPSSLPRLPSRRPVFFRYLCVRVSGPSSVNHPPECRFCPVSRPVS